jgi:hypothetical protein
MDRGPLIDRASFNEATALTTSANSWPAAVVVVVVVVRHGVKDHRP